MDNLKKGRDLGVAIIFVAKIFAVGGGKGVLGFPQIHADKRRRFYGWNALRMYNLQFTMYNGVN